MEKEISFFEFSLMIVRFIKRHLKRYFVTALLFVVVSVGIYLFQKPTQRTTLSLTSDFFSKKDFFSIVNSMNLIIAMQDSVKIKKQFGIENTSLLKNIKAIKCDTLQPVFTNISVDLFDAVDSKKIINSIVYFIQNNEYALMKINEIYNNNKYLLHKFERIESHFFEDQKENLKKKSNIVYVNGDMLNTNFYDQVLKSRNVVDAYNNNKIVNFYSTLSFSEKMPEFRKIEIIFFLVIFFMATFIFFILDLNRLSK